MNASMYYHSSLRTVIGAREMITPETLAEIRGQIPEGEAYQLKFVVVPLSEGLDAQKDVEVFSGYLNSIATMRLGGMDPDVLKAFLDKQESRTKHVPKASKIEMPSLEAELKQGDRLRNRDPRRPHIGVIKDVKGDSVVVHWDNGLSRTIKTKRVLQDHRYDVLRT
jgi:hypothetical protein